MLAVNPTGTFSSALAGLAHISSRVGCCRSYSSQFVGLGLRILRRQDQTGETDTRSETNGPCDPRTQNWLLLS